VSDQVAQRRGQGRSVSRALIRRSCRRSHESLLPGRPHDSSADMPPNASFSGLAIVQTGLGGVDVYSCFFEGAKGAKVVVLGQVSASVDRGLVV
jgi:hypothetical protein